MEDGQSASLAMTAEDLPAESVLEVYDDGGQLLAVGQVDDNGDVSIDGFRDMTTDGAVSTYRVRAASVVNTKRARPSASASPRLRPPTIDDEIRFRAHKTQMYDRDTDGDVYKITARAFDQVYAQAINGGYDKAKLHDTMGDDLFEASGSTARMSTTRTEMEMIYEAVDFEFVKAYHSGGSDQTNEADEIDFALYYEGDWG